tara:strand:- start:6009 stop:6470 length:462 start_codon:yes stop_codon:yes gene_type:complete
MGVDIYGKAKINETYRSESRPDSENYFRSNWWFWRPIVFQMEVASPELFAKVKHWGSNDGDGFDNADDCIAMADALEKMEHLIIHARKEQEAMPDIDCKYCAGTGTRGEVDNDCNVCDGTGNVRPREADYPHDWEFTKEWIAFLRGCGGFEIC